MSIIRKFARPALASSFIISGVERLKDAEANQHLAKVLNLASKANPSLSVLQGNERIIGQALAGTQVVAAALFALGKAPRLSSGVLLATGAANAYVEYAATAADSKEAKAARRRAAVTNASLLGAIAITAVDTDGSPSLAWRASKLTDQVSKKTAQVTADVKDKTEEIFSH